MLQIVGAVLAGLGAVLLAVLLFLRLARRSRRMVVVHTRDLKSLKGVLVGSYPRWVVLRHSVFLQGDGETELAGDVVVERSNISFIQRTG